LEIDVWIPELKVGIEYQGIQHFEVIDHWGGEDGLRKRKENDAKKKKICKSLGYNLIEFRYDENTTEEKLKRELEHLKVR
jgi:very-short-patch-repair endonuclease